MFEWFLHTRIIQGEGALASMGERLGKLGAGRAVIISDRGVRGAGLADKVMRVMGKRCAGVFDDVRQDTALDVIDRAADFARSCEADAVVSVGGGSVIDTAKVVSLLLGLGGRAADHAGFFVLKERGVPHLSVPTTAGTGSEVTPVALVMSEEEGRKIYYFSEHVAPDVAVLEPAMTADLPPGLTASTGMDALTHAVESVCSTMKNPISTALALRAIRSISASLSECVRDGSNLARRADMQAAATMAGMAFALTQVGLAHAIAHALGAVAGVPHGTANGIILPEVVRFNAPACPAEMADVAVAMGAVRDGAAEAEAAGAVSESVERLLDETGHPTKLADVGVREEDIPRVAKAAMADPAIITNPRKVGSADELEELIRGRM